MGAIPRPCNRLDRTRSGKAATSTPPEHQVPNDVLPRSSARRLGAWGGTAAVVQVEDQAEQVGHEESQGDRVRPDGLRRPVDARARGSPAMAATRNSPVVMLLKSISRATRVCQLDALVTRRVARVFHHPKGELRLASASRGIPEQPGQQEEGGDGRQGAEKRARVIARHVPPGAEQRRVHLCAAIEIAADNHSCGPSSPVESASGSPPCTNSKPNRPLMQRWPCVTSMSIGEVTLTIRLSCTWSESVQPTPQ